MLCTQNQPTSATPVELWATPVQLLWKSGHTRASRAKLVQSRTTSAQLRPAAPKSSRCAGHASPTPVERSPKLIEGPKCAESGPHRTNLGELDQKGAEVAQSRPLIPEQGTNKRIAERRPHTRAREVVRNQQIWSIMPQRYRCNDVGWAWLLATEIKQKTSRSIPTCGRQPCSAYHRTFYPHSPQLACAKPLCSGGQAINHDGSHQLPEVSVDKSIRLMSPQLMASWGQTAESCRELGLQHIHIEV